MKLILSLVFCLIYSSSFSQLKSNLLGWYQGEIIQTPLAISDSADQVVYLNSSKVCFELKDKGFSLSLEDVSINGNLKAIEKIKGGFTAQLQTRDYGSFEIKIDKKRKLIFFNETKRIPKFIVRKLAKKGKCEI